MAEKARKGYWCFNLHNGQNAKAYFHLLKEQQREGREVNLAFRLNGQSYLGVRSRRVFFVKEEHRSDRRNRLA